MLVHVITQKGKGYKYAEDEPVEYHGPSPFDPVAGIQKAKSAARAAAYTAVFGKAIVKLAEHDPRIVAITASMPDGTGLVPFAEKFPDRFLNTGIAEQHSVTLAGGLALGGMRPVVAIYSTFLQRGFDQIFHDVCLMDLPVVFALDRGGIAGNDGWTHHGLFDFAYFRIFPNTIVMAPKDENELQHMLATAVEQPHPTALRYPRGNGVGVALDAELRHAPDRQGRGAAPRPRTARSGRSARRSTRRSRPPSGWRRRGSSSRWSTRASSSRSTATCWRASSSSSEPGARLVTVEEHVRRRRLRLRRCSRRSPRSELRGVETLPTRRPRQVRPARLAGRAAQDASASTPRASTSASAPSSPAPPPRLRSSSPAPAPPERRAAVHRSSPPSHGRLAPVRSSARPGGERGDRTGAEVRTMAQRAVARAKSTTKTKRPAARAAAARRVDLLVATIKGAFVLKGDASRKVWKVEGPHYLGCETNHLVLDPRDGKTLLIAASTGHLGPTIFRSTDGGRNWKEAERPPAFPKVEGGDGPAVKHDLLPRARARERAGRLVGRHLAARRSSARPTAASPGIRSPGFNEYPRLAPHWSTPTAWSSRPTARSLHSIRVDPRDARHMYVSTLDRRRLRDDGRGRALAAAEQGRRGRLPARSRTPSSARTRTAW